MENVRYPVYMDLHRPDFPDSRNPVFSDSGDPMIIFSDSMDPNGVPKTPEKKPDLTDLTITCFRKHLF